MTSVVVLKVRSVALEDVKAEVEARKVDELVLVVNDNVVATVVALDVLDTVARAPLQVLCLRPSVLSKLRSTVASLRSISLFSLIT